MAENVINSVTVNGTNYKIGIPTANENTLGGIKIGKGLSMDGNNKLNVNIGTGLSFKENILVSDVTNYELPAASEDILGGIKLLNEDTNNVYLGDNKYGVIPGNYYDTAAVKINSIEHIVNIDSTVKRLAVKEYPNNTTFICEEPVEILLPADSNNIVNYELGEIMNYNIIYKELQREQTTEDPKYLFVMLDTTAEVNSINASNKVFWENVDSIPNIGTGTDTYYKFNLKAYTETQTDGIYNQNEIGVGSQTPNNGKVHGDIIKGNYFVTYSKYSKIS